MWLDVSEPGTLSRKGTDVVQVIDKAPREYHLKVVDAAHRPKILQSRFNGKTVLRFNSPQQLIGVNVGIDPQEIAMVGVFNKQLQFSTGEFMSIGTDIIIPANTCTDVVEMAELLIYDRRLVMSGTIDFVATYLSNKWQVENRPQYIKGCV